MIGLAGRQGESGDSGDLLYPPNTIGYRGVIGDKGFPGYEGPIGLVGPEGAPGFDGLVGIKGEKVGLTFTTEWQPNILDKSCTLYMITLVFASFFFCCHDSDLGKRWRSWIPWTRRTSWARWTSWFKWTGCNATRS